MTFSPGYGLVAGGTPGTVPGQLTLTPQAPAVLRLLFNHPLTEKGLVAFLADWAKTGQQIA